MHMDQCMDQGLGPSRTFPCHAVDCGLRNDAIGLGPSRTFPCCAVDCGLWNDAIGLGPSRTFCTVDCGLRNDAIAQYIAVPRNAPIGHSYGVILWIYLIG